MNDADDVLAHSEDPDEWEDEPVVVERRPSGKQVLSARLPTGLTELVFGEAARLGVSTSEVVRLAVETYFAPRRVHVIRVHPGARVHVFGTTPSYETENPVVTDGVIPALRRAM